MDNKTQEKIENAFHSLWASLEIDGLYFSDEVKQIVYDYLMNKITKKEMEDLLDAW